MTLPKGPDQGLTDQSFNNLPAAKQMEYLVSVVDNIQKQTESYLKSAPSNDHLLTTVFEEYLEDISDVMGRIQTLEKQLEKERKESQENTDEALDVATEAMKTARSYKEKVRKILVKVVEESNTYKGENTDLNNKIKELSARISALLDRIARLEESLKSARDENESHQRRADNTEDEVRNKARRWKRRERELLDALEKARRDLLNTRTELSIVTQAPAPAQPPIIIHPPAAATAPHLDLSPLLAEIRALRDLMSQQKQKPSTPRQPIVVNSPAPDNSAILLILERLMDKMGSIPEAIKQLNQQSSDPDTGLSKENDELKRLIAERESQLQALHDEVQRFREEANDFYVKWQEALGDNMQLREQLNTLKQSLADSQETIDNLRRALRSTLEERDTARKERDNARDQRDLLRAQRDGARDERDEANEELQKLEGALAVSEEEKKNAEEAKKTAEDERDKANDGKKKAERERDAANDNLKKAGDQSDEDKNERRENRKKMQRDLDAANGDKEKAQKERDEANNAKNEAEEKRKAAEDAKRNAEGERDTAMDAGRTVLEAKRNLEKDNQHLQNELAKRDATIEDLQRKLAEALARASSVVITTTSDQSLDSTISGLKDRQWTSSTSRTERRYPKAVQMESMSISTRLQSLETIVEGLNLSAKHSMYLIASAMPDIELLRDIFEASWRYNNKNVCRGTGMLLNSEKGSGVQLMSFIQERLKERNLPYREPSENEIQLQALANAWQRKVSQYQTEMKVADGVFGRTGQVVFPPNADFTIRDVIAEANETLKRRKKKLFPKNYYRLPHESLEMALDRLIKRLLPEEGSTGRSTLSSVGTVHSTCASMRKSGEMSKEEELGEIRREMKSKSSVF